MNKEQYDKVQNGKGFIAALDQSGGSTPKALEKYGVKPSEYEGDDEMFRVMHEMRTRIIKSPAFTGKSIVGAILFEGTMERDIDGQGSAEYLWSEKEVVPFLKVDKGLEDEDQGVQVMKPIPELDGVLHHATEHGVFGTKMRSVIKLANPAGIERIVAQQFEIARDILDHDLVPILEPEVDINSPEKAAAEDLLKTGIAKGLAELPDGAVVMLKLTLPDTPNLYSDFVQDPSVLRVVALSGGYSREKANELLAQNNGVIASFSRGLTEGLSAQQSDEEFNATLEKAISGIYEASVT
ncbi:MAG TPA: fructose bisphosphate aldolase [Actinomycetota bacterium]|nr:fructose bisphosphate aldolase [Actinomycetota bacterium]